MKVAIICSAGIVSGKEIMALELGDGLRAKGEQVVYVTSLWGNGDFIERISEKSFLHYKMRLGFISATFNFDCMRMTGDQLIHWPKLLYDYNRFLEREKPAHVIHTNWHHIMNEFLHIWQDVSTASALYLRLSQTRCVELVSDRIRFELSTMAFLTRQQPSVALRARQAMTSESSGRLANGRGTKMCSEHSRSS